MKITELVNIHDYNRKPISKKERSNLKGIYPYYGAQGIIDYINKYIFDGEYILIAEDGNNLISLNMPIAILVKGKFWVSNHAHVVSVKKERIKPKYLLWLINKINLREFITGSAQPKLNLTNLSNITFKNLPNIKKQQHIIDIIEPFEKLENKLNEIKLKINKIKKILFESSKTNKIFISELLELNKKIKIQDLSLSQIFVNSKKHEIKFKKNVNYSGTIYEHKVGDLLIPKTSYFSQSIACIKINKKYLLSNDQPVYKNKSSYNSLLILETIVSNNILIKLAKSSSRGAVIKRVPENLILKQQIILPNEENIKILNSFYNFIEEINKKLFKIKNIKQNLIEKLIK